MSSLRSLTASTAVAVVLTVGTGRWAHAAVILIPAFQDATLFGGPANTGKSSSGPGMFVGTDAQRLPKRGLISFDVASYLPAGATVTGATLSLTLGQLAGGSGGESTPVAQRTIRLFDATTPWQGSTNGTTGYPGPGFSGTGQGFPANTGDTTWVYASYNSRPWATPGGDFASSESADTVVGDAVGTEYTWGSTAQMVTDVQGWLDGTVPNYGWLLRNDDETGQYSYGAFYTREGAAEQSLPQYAPTLNITYNQAVPEPSSLALLIVGVLGGTLTRRRRQACSGN